METGEHFEPGVLQLRVVLRDITPMIWRRLLVRGDSSVAELHQVLQIVFGWEDMHLHRFEIRGREYGSSREDGVIFETDARKVLIGDLKLRRMERFTYAYDFGDCWLHDLRIEATLPIDSTKTYPVCIAGVRSGPPEDCGGPYAFMENRWRYELIGSGESRDELAELADDIEDEEWEIHRSYHPDRFDRRAINRILAKLISSGGSHHEVHDPGPDRKRRRHPSHRTLGDD